ncbi:MAG: hypothetical protein AAF657_30665 [Acidobacteriota bacterium]
MGNHIIFIHGRKPKPKESILRDFWYEAIRHGLHEDHGSDVVNAFNDAEKSFVYYGDLSLKTLAEDYLDNPNDENEHERLLADLATEREKTLKELQDRKRDSFDEDTYEAMCEPRETFLSLRTAVVSVLIDGAHIAHANEAPVQLIGWRREDLDLFWDRSAEFGKEVRNLFKETLAKAMSDDDRVLVISHSLGTMVAYDCFWWFSWIPGRSTRPNGVVDTWVTLGSPLGAEFVQNKLFGADERGPRRYPSNVRKWFNFAAEDDYIASDEDVRNDFRRMKSYHGTKIRDKEIYSLAKRGGKSNPHAALGYLIHPDVSATIADWLRA